MFAKKVIVITSLIVLFSGSMVAYLVHLQQETKILKQRIAELTQELAQTHNEPGNAQLKQATEKPATAKNTPLKQLATISDGGSINDKNKTLTNAVMSGDLETLRALIESGANLSAINANGQSLLHLAAQSGQAEVLALLVEAGLDISAIDNRGRTPLHLAAESGQTLTAQQLIELGASLEALDARGSTPLMTAVRNKNSDMVTALIGAGADSTVTTAFDMSLLHTAAYQGDRATVSALLNGGFDVEAVDAKGRTALHYAEADMVPLLVKARLNVNQPDAAGNTPIFNAMNGGEVERAGALYAAGADASSLLPEKDNHLLRTAQFGQADLGTYLISHGADVNAGVDAGMTALDIAIKNEHDDMAVLLQSHGGIRANP